MFSGLETSVIDFQRPARGGSAFSEAPLFVQDIAENFVIERQLLFEARKGVLPDFDPAFQHGFRFGKLPSVVSRERPVAGLPKPPRVRARWRADGYKNQRSPGALLGLGPQWRLRTATGRDRDLRGCLTIEKDRDAWRQQTKVHDPHGNVPRNITAPLAT